VNPTSKTDRNEGLSEQDLEQLHADDLHAARLVVGLIAGVFFMGLLLYSFIWWIVWW
jgi:hypothetical protein